jgi:cytochrome c553
LTIRSQGFTRGHRFFPHPESVYATATPAKEKDPILRTLQRFATVCFIGAAFAALFSACSSTDTPTNPGGAGAPGAGAPAAGAPGAGAPAAGAPGAGGGSAGGGTGLTGNAANGMTVYNASSTGCNGCHGTMGEGALGPNITGSKMFGIGNWTQAQFHDALRSGKDKSGAMFNGLMLPVSEAAATDQAVADLYAYLMSHSVETMNAGSVCTPGQCKGTH